MMSKQQIHVLWIVGICMTVAGFIGIVLIALLSGLSPRMR